MIKAEDSVYVTFDFTPLFSLSPPVPQKNYLLFNEKNVYYLAAEKNSANERANEPCTRRVQSVA